MKHFAKRSGGGIRKLREFLLGEGMLFCLEELCYDDLFWLIPLQVLMVPYFYYLKRRKREKLQRQYERGFRELLPSMMTSIQAGYSLENACRTAERELCSLRSSSDPTMTELHKIVRGIELHIPVERLFLEYAKTTENEDIYQFATVLAIARETGGNMVEMIRNAMEHLQKKMNTAEEIRVILSGKLLEKNVMLLMPLGVLVYMRLFNPSYTRCITETMGGHILISAVLAAVCGCFFWTEQMIRTEI